MSRTVINLVCDNPKNSEIVIKDILNQYNYELKEKNGEQFYQCGVGFLTAPKYIKYSFDGNNLRLEGWVRAFLGRESELNGFVASVPKRSCKKTLDDIQNNLDGVSVNNEIKITAEEKSHTLAIVLGVIFAFLIPIVGIIFGVYLVSRKDSEKSKTFGAGIILLSLIIYAVSRMLLMG